MFEEKKVKWEMTRKKNREKMEIEEFKMAVQY